MSVDVSVVVPVYNTELYLNQCVDSLLAQTMKNVEFIFVDDGSTDRSVEILKEYQQKDPRITILQQKNQFAGVARNNGMKAATGKYIIFVDSDDFFEPTMLEDAFNCAEANKAEIVVFDFDYFDNKSGEVKPGIERKFPRGVFTLRDVGESFFRQYIAAPWNKLFLHSFIKESNLSFQAVKKCNDTYFTIMAAYLADSIVHLQRTLTYYRINNSSSLQGNTDVNREAFIAPIEGIKLTLKERGLFNSLNRKALSLYTADLIRLYCPKVTSNFDQFNIFFLLLKQRITPQLFDDPSDFEEYRFIKNLYESRDITEFLLAEIRRKDDTISQLNEKIRSTSGNSVSKNSKDYILGHTLLTIPRAFISLWKK